MKMKSEKSCKICNILYHYGVRNIPISGVSVSTMIHEYGHLISSKLLGFGGYIKSGKLTAVYYESLPIGSQWSIFYISGGALQFIVFFLMSLRGEDNNVKIANRMTAIIGLIEALTEPVKYLRLSGLGSSIGIITSMLYLAYIVATSKTN
jgi:hypothetical protein